MNAMPLALFDLDNTLLTGDSDCLWGQYLVRHRMVHDPRFEEKNLLFFKEYEAGTLNMEEYLTFQLGALAQHEKSRLDQMRLQFLDEVVRPMIAKKTPSILEKHRRQGDMVVIITATNAFVTTPIAEALGVDHLIATEVEIVDGRYTGRPKGIPCFKEGKVIRLKQWLEEHQQSLSGSWFYSDSHNDLPLLQTVDHPVAVDPDKKLADYAKAHQWPIVSFRS